MNQFEMLKKIFILFFLLSGLLFAVYSRAKVGGVCETNNDCETEFNEVCGEDHECIDKSAPKTCTTNANCTTPYVCGIDMKCSLKACIDDSGCSSFPGTTCVAFVCKADAEKKAVSGGDTVPSNGVGTSSEKGKDVFISAGKTELTSPIGEIDFLTLIGGRIIPAILGFVGVLAVLAVIYGGITYMLSFGNEQKMEIGKKILTYAVLGILAIAASYMIIQTIISLTTSQ